MSTLFPIICQSCKKEFYVRPYRKDTARFCSSYCWTTSPESKQIVSASVIQRHKRSSTRGNRNSNWRGGITPDYKIRLLTPEWKRLRKQVLIDFNYKCRYCGNERNLHVHHIIPYREGGEDEYTNLEVVCNKCHPKIEKEQFYIRIIKVKCQQCKTVKTKRSMCSAGGCPLHPDNIIAPETRRGCAPPEGRVRSTPQVSLKNRVGERISRLLDRLSDTSINNATLAIGFRQGP